MKISKNIVIFVISVLVAVIVYLLINTRRNNDRIQGMNDIVKKKDSIMKDYGLFVKEKDSVLNELSKKDTVYRTKLKEINTKHNELRKKGITDPVLDSLVNSILSRGNARYPESN